MYRIDDPSASATLPTPEAALTEGYWTEGNPGTGTPATLERASWFNMVQEELRAIVVAGGLTPSKTTYNQIYQAILKITTGRLLRTTIYINNAGTLQSSVDGSAFANASSTFSPLAITSSVEVEVLGGGGGGGGGAITVSSQVSAGAGGGGGGGARKRLTSGFSGVAITVGAGGAAAAATAGTTGGTSSFGAVVSCPGGTGGSLGAAASNATNSLNGGGNGALGTGGDINVLGGFGQAAFYSSAPISGKGGSSMYGEGANPVSGSSSGNAASSYGSGGSGGSCLAGVGTGSAGGVGKSGLLIVREYA